jgi:LysR family glycine cleavage system transcriptional activator
MSAVICITSALAREPAGDGGRGSAIDGHSASKYFSVSGLDFLGLAKSVIMSIDPPRPRLPPLNALRAFEAAARHESFAKAAHELGVTPAAIAQQVKSLEYWVRRPLFTRMSQGLRLTPVARQTLPGFIDAFDRLGGAVQELRRAALPEVVRLAALPSVAQLWLQPRLRALRKRFPRLELSVTALEQPPSFAREPYDLAIFYLAEEAPPGVTLRGLGSDELFPVCAPKLVSRRRKPVPVTALSDFVLLHDSTWRDHWDLWMAFARCGGRDTRQGPTFSLYSLALEAALDGAGMLIGRRTLVHKLLKEKRLVAPFDIVMPSPTRLCLMQPRATRRDAVVAGVADCLASGE